MSGLCPAERVKATGMFGGVLAKRAHTHGVNRASSLRCRCGSVGAGSNRSVPRDF